MPIHARPLRALSLVTCLGLLAIGCGEADPGAYEDPADESFLDAGKADGTPRITEGSPEATAVLTLCNRASEDQLVDEGFVARRAARAIVAHRDGADLQAGTADDRPFGTLRELDDVRWVGKITLARLLTLARLWGLLEDPGTGQTGGGDAPAADWRQGWPAGPFTQVGHAQLPMQRCAEQYDGRLDCTPTSPEIRDLPCKVTGELTGTLEVICQYFGRDSTYVKGKVQADGSFTAGYSVSAGSNWSEARHMTGRLLANRVLVIASFEADNSDLLVTGRYDVRKYVSTAEAQVQLAPIPLVWCPSWESGNNVCEGRW